jgi:vacuolar-type H+-ATPase subunit H
VDPGQDGSILKRIFSAEREADRIVRDAEAEAAARLAEADGRVAGILSAGRRRLGDRRRLALEAAVAEADREAEGIVADARAAAEAWTARESRRIDELAGRLLEAVLPP